MRRKILPITVSTMEALTACVNEECRLVYMQWVFFEAYRLEIMQILYGNGYKRVDFNGRNGAFYAKGINPSKCFVDNPYGIY